MRRVLLHKQALLNFELLYFLLLILSVPTLVRDGVEEHPETPAFVCDQSHDDGEPYAPSVILESVAAMDSSISKANQTLDTKLWALKFDREIWHGDLIDDVQPAVPVLNATLVTSDRQAEKPWDESTMTVKGSTAEIVNEDGKGTLVMHCHPERFRGKSAHQNYSSHNKCLKVSHQVQSSMITLAKGALPGQVVILPSPNVHHPLIFRLHNRCAWTDKNGPAHQGHPSSTVLSFYDGKRAVHTLELGFNSSDFSPVEDQSFTERFNWLLDEKRTKYACNQTISKEFTVRNTGNSSLQVYSLMIMGENNLTHGFKVDFLRDALGEGQSAKLLISHQPDFKTGVMTEGDLQLATSAGILSIVLKANIPTHVLSFCQDAVLFAKARKFFLQVCTLALFLVLLVFGKMLKQESSVMSDASQRPSSPSNAIKLSQRSHGDKGIQDQNDKGSSIY